MNPTQDPPQQPPEPAPQPTSEPTITPASQPLSQILQPGRLAVDKNKFANIVMSNPKLKYGLIAVVLPIIVIVILVSGGSLGDFFLPKISGRELSLAIETEIKARESSYGFTVIGPSKIVCDGGLKNVRDATVDCTIDTKPILFGDIEEQVKATARVRLPKTDTRPITVELINIVETQ
ncbi:MAG: hypothetical protein WA030_01835 [Candidatus Microsaccharimonas sp.]